MAKTPSEFDVITIFGKNILLPTNYYLIDSSTTFSTTKVIQICDDLKNALSPDTNVAGLIRLNNGATYVGFYEIVGSNYISITLSTYDGKIILIGIANNVAYSKTVTGT